jgi:hypothetical protein
VSVYVIAALIALTLLLVLGAHLFLVWLLQGEEGEQMEIPEPNRRAFWKALERWRREKPRSIEDRRSRKKAGL